MPRPSFRRLALPPILVALGVAAALAIASTPNAPAQPSARSGKLTVGVAVLRFTPAGRKLTATGYVNAKLTDNHGRTTTVRTTVALVAAAGGGCKVLHLYLNQLNLVLLGLTAHLDKVQLDLTGNPAGGVLGSLFCKLAKAKVASARASAARALTAAVERHRGDVVRFTASLTPKTTASQAANATCQVLDLVVGPLNLQLLGLVVNLNQVHLSVTATRGQGALGDLFCQLADNPTPASSTPIPTTTTPTTSTASPAAAR